ncbi:hypothetical protein C5167_013041 [Papaver somniferum]|uniref:FLZ-type domain-containing protein n=1 Tax=Papaver somniferum TaxID=3469 RepID=A0A4Y7J3F3_PAPSO|nr:uncharacterized protein LOC113356174 [Papaver somniferum]RZC54175.1 hypothetical protein C5167_013041 [Papaver somniferum]
MYGKVKRSRIPSTHKDIHVLDQDIEYVRNNFSSKISISEQQQPVVCSSDAQPPKKKILTVNKMRVHKSDRFYEFCHYCKDYISENANVFMYGYLGAYCGTACRSQQIQMDTAAEKFSNAARRNGQISAQFGKSKRAFPIFFI